MPSFILIKQNLIVLIFSRWSAMPNPKEYFSMNISSSAVDILLELQTIFSNLSINLLKSISNEIRARIIIEFDEYLFITV